VDDDEIIRKDTVVMISEVDGVRLAVKKLEREKN
jgi:hypothetical protein